MLPGLYKVANYHLEALGVMTNKAPSGAYCGYGAPEAAFVIEGLMDRLARQVGVDPVEFRRRNLIGHDQFPFRTASGLSYDNRDVSRLLDSAVLESGYEEHRQRHPSSSQRSGQTRDGYGSLAVFSWAASAPLRRRSRPVCTTAATTPPACAWTPTAESLFTGLPTQGQGLDTALAQICAGALGLDAERDVRVVACDTSVTPYSPVGPIASRGVAVGGSAVRRASEKVADILRVAAAEMMEASPADIELADGRVAVRGVPDRSLSLASVARAVKEGRYQSKGVEPALEAVATFEPQDLTYSFVPCTSPRCGSTSTPARYGCSGTGRLRTAASSSTRRSWRAR